MAQENLTEAIDKRFGNSLAAFLKLCDPERRYEVTIVTSKAWSGLTLTDQRKLYLYLLYRKWRGIDIYGEPYYVIRNCHPVPFDWNGSARCAELINEGKVRIACYNGKYGWFTKDEIALYDLETKER